MADDDFDALEVAGRIRQTREKLQISARECDRRAGLAEGHTALIEGGRGLTVKTAVAIARVLDVSLDWLVNGDEAA